ncbi:MAG: Gfo/Idh/MocA family protein [Limisphaerales bacterium]
MPKKSYGVLIHGAGWVSARHAAAFQANPATRVVAVSSRSLASARRRADESGLRDVACFDDLAEALRHPGVDLVSICTPQHVHCANVLMAARAGKHLVIEKPAGISPAELSRMRAAVRRAGVKTVVSFVLRWNPLFQTLKAMQADGAFGNVYSVEADYLSHNGNWWSGWTDTRTRKNGVSAMLVAGCHAIDALRWFAGKGRFEAADPVEVFAVSGGYRRGRRDSYDPIRNTWVHDAPPMEYDGLEIALVKFANGVVGKVSVNFDCVMPYRFPIRIFGDRGTVFDNRIWSHRFPGQKDWVELPTIQPDSVDVSHHPFQAQMDHFIECLQRGVESHCNLDDAIKTHEVVFAALRSQRTHRPVRLPHSKAR